MKHFARKRFGQNFLHDPNVINRIITTIDPNPDQHLVEIGPGLGALTRELLPIVHAMDAIELDRDLVPKLEHACASLGKLTVHSADALKFDFSQLVKHDEKLRIIGNLPYNISTPLMFHLFDQMQVIEDMHFMLQKEVVDRIVSSPGSNSYGRLSVMVQYYCKPMKLFAIGAGAFNPQPKVESAIVRLLPYDKQVFKAKDEKAFARLVNQAFSKRRKTIRNCMKDTLSTEQLENLGIDSGLRPEMLSLEQFVLMSNMAGNSA